MRILLTSLILAWCLLRTVTGNDIGCEQGFTKENDTCIQVLGRSCTLPFSEDPECVDERTWCGGDSTCSCRNDFFEMNGTCVTVLGRNCSWPFSEAPECGGDRTWCGQDSTCSCREGFIEENGACVTVIGHNCTVNNDCWTSYMYYYTVCDPDSSICTCREGYALEDDVCTQVLYRSCISDDDCPFNITICNGACICREDRAVQSNDICIEVYGQSCQYGCAENMYCALDFTCTCLPGFFFNGEYCETDISKACVENNDCFAEGLVCSDDTCKCGDGYYQSGSSSSCLIALGSKCEDNPCVDNGDCSTNYCECKQGYYANGTKCVEVATIYGSKCTHEIQCRKLNNSRCDSKGYCQCQSGFIFSITDCIKVLGTECSQINCSLLENSICGTNNTCVCEESFSEYNNVCSASNCQNVTSSMPDLSARFCLYNMSLNVPSISDHLLEEGWYRTDDHHIPTIDNGATINSCGSSYPIVVKEQDPNYYDALTVNPKSLVAVVAGLTHGSEEIDIKVRRCPDGLHYYLKPPKTRPAAYCYFSINNGELFQPAEYSEYAFYGDVRPHLRFYQEETDKGLMDKPFSVWECQSSWYDHSRFPTSVLVGILWFLNDVHIQTKGPIRHWNLQTDHSDAYRVSNLELTEFELIDAGGKIGNELSCGILYSLDESFGQYLRIPISNGYKLWFIGGSSSMYVADTQAQLGIYNNIPIGCLALVASEETHCNISFEVTYPDGSPVCHTANPGNSDTQPICEFYIPALTRYGVELGSYDDFNSAITNIHGQIVYDTYYLRFMIQPTDNYIDGLKTKIHFQKAEPTGQQIFDNYNFPPIEVDIVKQLGPPPLMSREHVQHQNQEITWNVYHYYVEPRTLHISAEGEYLLLRSTDYVFQLHGEIRNCNEAKLCLCGVYIQYYNDIYMYRLCGGHLIAGFGLGYGDNFPIIRNIDGILGSLNTPDGHTNIGIRHNDIGLTLSMDLTPGKEGIYSIGEAGKLQGRDGVLYDNGADFLETWRLPDDESLLNPGNYRQYRIATEYAVCKCPSPTINIPSPVVTYEDEYQINRDIYTGVIQCQLDQTCTDITEGEVWKSTLLPDFVINATTVTTELLYTQDLVPVLVFRCMFNLIYGYKYTIVWYVNDILLKESDYLQADKDETFTVTDDEIYNSNKVEFALDMKIQCSANVFDLQEIAYGDPVLSQAFYPFEIISNDIALIRGRNAKLSVKVNIPKMCPKTSRQCDLQFQILDTSDSHSCKNSTIAMIGNSGCGTTLNFMSTQPTSTGDIIATTTITTKNNNKYRLKNFYDLRVKVLWIGAETSIWNGFLEKSAEVTVTETFMWRRQRCYSHVDPYLRTFDGRYYDIQLPGEFIMFRHTALEIEIQTIIKPCYDGRGSWAPFCSCGVLMRAGRDVYSINHCNGHVTGYLSADDKILRVYRRNLRYYQVRFPTGMYVNVFIRPWFHNVMDIDIYPTPADAESIEGLCGNFNGDTGDDLQMRNGSITNDPDQFAWSWGLTDSNKVSEESLRLPENYKNQSPWKRENQLCVCQDPNSSLGGAICSANEEETCSSAVKHKGYSLFPTSRLKRDARYINLDFERRMTFDIEDSNKPGERVKRSTNYALSLDTAREMCEEAFKNCTLSLIEGTPVDQARHLEECAKDVAVNGTLEWFQAHCEALGLELEQELDRDEEYAEQNPEIVVITSQTLDCSDCSGNGDCVNGTCQCNPGFGSDICLVNLSRIVEVAYIFGDGYCDMNVDGSCQDFIVESDGFVPDFSALVDVKEASIDGIFRYKEMQSGETEYLSFNEGIVFISNTGDQPSTTADDPTLAYQFGISVSNNGVDFGNPKYVTVYDSRCQEISNSSNGEIVVILKSGTCFIEGTCYNEDDRSPSDDCLVCKSSINSRFNWTAVNCVADESSMSDNVLAVYVIIIIVLGSLFLVAVAAVVIIKTWLCNQKPVVPYPRMPDGPKKVTFFVRNYTGRQRGLLNSQCGMEDNNDNQNGLYSRCGIGHDNDNQNGLNSQYGIEHDNDNLNSLVFV